MVCVLARRWPIRRSVKNACMVAAIAVIAGLLVRDRAGGRPRRAARARRAGTSYSDVGITGITPISGLFRYLLLCARDGSVDWDDAFWRLSPAGIIQWVSCAHEASFLTFSAHVIVPPCSSERRAGSPSERGQCHGVDGVWAG